MKFSQVYSEFINNVTCINKTLEENSFLESQIVELQEKFERLESKLIESKAERDTIIGKNYSKMNTMADSEISQKLSLLEDSLVKIKLDHGKLSEQVLESEDFLEFYINSCRRADSRINLLKKELERIKDITPVNRASVPNIEYNKPATSLNKPIQLKKGSHVAKTKSMPNSLKIN